MKGSGMDATGEVTEVIGALTGLLGGAATLVAVLRRKQPDAIPAEVQAEIDALRERLERLVSEKEDRLGGRSNGATNRC